MPPALDVYALSNERNVGSIKRFLQTYVDVPASSDRGDEQLMVWPSGFDGPEGDIPLEHYDWIEIPTLDAAIEYGLADPSRAFRIYLQSKVEGLCGAILCFTRSGGVIFGLRVDDPMNTPERADFATTLMSELTNQTHGIKGWVVCEEPPPLDPARELPWASDYNVARLE